MKLKVDLSPLEKKRTELGGHRLNPTAVSDVLVEQVPIAMCFRTTIDM